MASNRRTLSASKKTWAKQNHEVTYLLSFATLLNLRLRIQKAVFPREKMEGSIPVVHIVSDDISMKDNLKFIY